MKGIQYLLEINEKLNGKMYTRKPAYETGSAPMRLVRLYQPRISDRRFLALTRFVVSEADSRQAV